MTALSNENPTFSFLLPTRNRAELVKRFLASVLDTTARPDQVEVILAIDDDDPESRQITHESLRVKTVVVPSGATMGNLNRACFDASSGRYVMLINDDVILRTMNWDLIVAAAFARYEDDIGLIHVNDLLFREQLCTFPILSRKSCLEIGLCQAEYRRYKIDDDIYATYHMLAHLGHKRITYLPEVIFEHENFEQITREHRKAAGSLYIAEDDKVYLPNPEFHEHDARIFEARIEGRKQDALKLAALIDSYGSKKNQQAYRQKLIDLENPYDYRRPGHVTIIPAERPDSSAIRVTVAVVTSDIYKKHAQKCLTALKQHTRNFDLLILDNNNGGGFVHAREMNKVLRSVNTDFLVLMDDDVFVEAGWLEGLLAAVDAETGVVAPMHKGAKGTVSFSGAYMMGDEWGSHAHLTDTPATKRECQALCSALLLIDVSKCGQIFFDEQYKKYFFDLTHSFKVWEAGYKVVCTPEVIVTHVGGATMSYQSQRSQLFFNRDLRTFVEEWIETGRLARLENLIWLKNPLLEPLTTIPRRINSVLGNVQGWEDAAFRTELNELVRLSQPYDLFKGLIYRGVCRYLNARTSGEDQFKAQVCAEIREQLKDAPWVQSGPIPVQIEFYQGYEIVKYGELAYAVPVTLDYLVIIHEETRSRDDILKAESVEALKKLVDQTIEKDGRPGGSLVRLRWELIRFDKWLRRDRRNRLFDFATWSYVQIPRRVVVACSIRWRRYALRQ